MTNLDDSLSASEQTFPVGYGRDILVVDDNETNLIAIEVALEQIGRNLVFARSGKEALSHLLDQDFALILLDVSMPGIDGFETARMIRGRERNRATPIIFVTGVAWHDDAIMRGYDLGAFDYLLKPIKAEVLRAKAQVFVNLQERTIALHEAQVVAHLRQLEAQRHELEAAAMEARMKQLVEVDRQKDEFIAILAHELRNPLQPLLSVIDMIDAAPDSAVPDRTRQILRRHIHHMKRLVDDLLDVARFTSRKLELRRETVPIDQIIEQAVTQTRSVVEGRMHDLVIHRAGEAALVDADPMRLVQVVSNLITNAARYTSSAGRIEIRASHDEHHVIVKVIDNGRGISPLVLPKIFDMFVQERVSPDGAGGLGLGLGLVKRLIELHGGNVHGSSDGDGKGSTFEIRLPRAVPGSKAEPAAAEAPISLKPLRAVVCDDAADIRELLAEMLRSRGHEVTTAADGQAALHAILKDKPDVAVIDVGLPGMSGYDVARAVRRELAELKPRLVAMTGFGRPSDRAAAIDAGFDAHVSKPASSDDILRALQGDKA